VTRAGTARRLNLGKDMVTIKLHNTKTRKKDDFSPIDPDNVRMYVCGPTVYDRAHLGNARPVVVFDVLYRLLRHVYGEGHVTYVRNFTDVDDKINAEALRRQQAGDPRPLEALIAERTEETIGWYHADMDALGALRPNHEPRATEYIPQMVAMIEDLITKGHAYVEDRGADHTNSPDAATPFDPATDPRHVLFSVKSYKPYGQLSGRSVDDMIAGARVEVANNKRDPMDFVLWKPSDADQPGWPSPWGRGRPGWHIECSAMADELLMKDLPEAERAFDIHGGGLDLQFPHHENELAQSRCAHPHGGFANVWMHNEMLQVEGKKMSKSLGNFFTVRDLLDQGVPGEVIRFVLLSTHYGKPMDWTKEKADQAKATLRDWAAMALGAAEQEPDSELVEALADDLNTSEAITQIADMHRRGDRDALASSALLLGFDLANISRHPWARAFSYEAPDGRLLQEGSDYMPTVGVLGWGEISDEVRDASLALVHRWLALRRDRNFQKADELRNASIALGVELRATRSSNGINAGQAILSGEIDPSKLESLK
jgi:cysteinyl-tRNA synthetase